MKTRTIDIPEELLDHLKQSRLGKRSGTDQVRTALAILLFLEGLVSIGKAAELAGEPRVEFEWLLAEMGIPTVRYELADYEEDLRGLAEAERRQKASRGQCPTLVPSATRPGSTASTFCPNCFMRSSFQPRCAMTCCEQHLTCQEYRRFRPPSTPVGSPFVLSPTRPQRHNSVPNWTRAKLRRSR